MFVLALAWQIPVKVASPFVASQSRYQGEEERLRFSVQRCTKSGENVPFF